MVAGHCEQGHAPAQSLLFATADVMLICITQCNCKLKKDPELLWPSGVPRACPTKEKASSGKVAKKISEQM